MPGAPACLALGAVADASAGECRAPRELCPEWDPPAIENCLSCPEVNEGELLLCLECGEGFSSTASAPVVRPPTSSPPA